MRWGSDTRIVALLHSVPLAFINPSPDELVTHVFPGDLYL
jgi:hypothetical protein